jgi:hydrogenase 3 maturation protease
MKKSPETRSNRLLTSPPAVNAMELREQLATFFGKLEGRRVVLVGIGSSIRRDDAVGLYILDLLEGKISRDVLLLNTETVPESYTGAIREFQPTHVLLIDAAHFNGKPGEGRIIPTEMIANTTVSTHSLPLNIFIDYIRRSICSEVALLGIQGVNLNMGEGLTLEVEKGAEAIFRILRDLLI